MTGSPIEQSKNSLYLIQLGYSAMRSIDVFFSNKSSL